VIMRTCEQRRLFAATKATPPVKTQSHLSHAMSTYYPLRLLMRIPQDSQADIWHKSFLAEALPTSFMSSSLSVSSSLTSRLWETASTARTVKRQRQISPSQE
jgi:hypothetical protein